MSISAAAAEAPAAATPRANSGTADTARPATARIPPLTNRARPMRVGPLEDSRSASIGSSPAGRRAAILAAAHAAPSTSSSAPAAGEGPTASAKSPGITPPETNALCSTPDRRYPGTMPRTPATTAIDITSRDTSACTCFGLAPTARRSAKSRRRDCTDSDSVPDTMNSATRTQVPTKALPIVTSVERAAPESRNSMSPRPAPVCTVRPGTASRIAAASSAASAPCAGNTPRVCAAPPRGSSSAMRVLLR